MAGSSIDLLMGADLGGAAVEWNWYELLGTVENNGDVDHLGRRADAGDATSPQCIERYEMNWNRQTSCLDGLTVQNR